MSLTQFASENPKAFERVSAPEWAVAVQIAPDGELLNWTLRAFDRQDAEEQALARWNSETGGKGFFRVCSVETATSPL